MPFDLTGYRIINGTSRSETLNGSALPDAIFGYAGNDTLNGSGAGDILDGGVGADVMRGGAGDDIYVVDSTGDILTEAFNEGIDTVYASVSRVLGANFENLVLAGEANINGTGNVLNNVLTGNSGINRLSGGDGNDKINAGAGADTLDGGNGKDALNGETGNDIISGGAGNDTLNGGGGDDTLRGGADTDGIFGGGGKDALFGDAGNDTLIGDGGSDTLRGGAGNDWLTGGQLKNGAPASDIFVWARADVLVGTLKQGFDHLTDFAMDDRLDMTGLFISHAVPADQVIRVTDTAAGSTISVKISSVGFVDIVSLDGVHTTVSDLIANGALIY